MSLEGFLCRRSKQLLAVSLQNVTGFALPTVRDLPLVEAYIAESAKGKLSVAESLLRGLHVMSPRKLKTRSYQPR